MLRGRLHLDRPVGMHWVGVLVFRLRFDASPEDAAHTAKGQVGVDGERKIALSCDVEELRCRLYPSSIEAGTAKMVSETSIETGTAEMVSETGPRLEPNLD